MISESVHSLIQGFSGFTHGSTLPEQDIMEDKLHIIVNLCACECDYVCMHCVHIHYKFYLGNCYNMQYSVKEKINKLSLL
jgi:hypothetical protein